MSQLAPHTPSTADERQPVRPVVFYDGACPVCRREIAHYRRLDRANRIDFADIAARPESLAGTGLTEAQAMRRFHVIDTHGRVRSGADAFTVIWAQLPGWRRLGQVVRALRLTRLMEPVYHRWAERRWRRRVRSGNRCARK